VKGRQAGRKEERNRRLKEGPSRLTIAKKGRSFFLSDFLASFMTSSLATNALHITFVERERGGGNHVVKGGNRKKRGGGRDEAIEHIQTGGRDERRKHGLERLLPLHPSNACPDVSSCTWRKDGGREGKYIKEGRKEGRISSKDIKQGRTEGYQGRNKKD
jgi:hypothetical protein